MGGVRACPGHETSVPCQGMLNKTQMVWPHGRYQGVSWSVLVPSSRPHRVTGSPPLYSDKGTP